MEVLGCGIVEQEILKRCGAGDKIGIFFSKIGNTKIDKRGDSPVFEIDR